MIILFILNYNKIKCIKYYTKNTIFSVNLAKNTLFKLTKNRSNKNIQPIKKHNYI